MKKLLLCFSIAILAFEAFAQTSLLVSPATVADVTGTGAAVQLFPSGGSARQVLIIAFSTNAANARCGDANVTASRGAPLVPGSSIFYPSINTNAGDFKQPLWNLANFYCYIASGDKVAPQYSN